MGGPLGKLGFCIFHSTAYPFGKGKVSVIKILKTYCPSLDHIGSPTSNKGQIFEAGHHFYLLLYGAQTDKTMHDFRNNIYTKKRDKAPSSGPSHLQMKICHVLQAHLHAGIWNAVDQDGPPDVNIENYRWEVKNDMSLPVAYNGPPAPPSIMKVIACGCNLS